MMRFVVLLAVVLVSLSCSKDRPAPVASASKPLASLAAPPAPTNLRFDAPTDSSCTVRWDASAGATHYYVNYRLASGGRWTNVPHQDVRLYNTIHDLQPNTAYRWAVRAQNSDGTSAWTFGPHFTTRPSEEDDSSDVPAAPTNLRFDAPTDSSCTVRWNASAGATDYDVSYMPASGGRWTNEPHAGDGLYNTIHDLEPGTAYRWAVRAENGNGASAWAFGPHFTTLSDNQSRDETGGDGSGSDDHGNTRSGATDLPLNSSLAGEIETGGDVDYFRVQVGAPGVLTLYTTGSLDTKGRLESRSGSSLANDDDGGSGTNFSIAHPVSAGTYYVRVESYSSRTGSYTMYASVQDDGDDRGDSASSERAALVALYHAMGGDNWRRNDNWLSDAPITEWYGVEGEKVFFGGKLYEGPIPFALYLGRNNLSGTIPPELGQLGQLRYLELHHNNLSGTIPPELGQLSNLITLWLGHNRLSGRIPPELGNLSNLKVANIIGNNFTGCLPSTWRNMNPGSEVPPYSLPFCGDTGGPSGAFDIELVYLDNGLSSAQKSLMAQATRRWEQVIIGDLPDISYRRYPYNEWDDFLQARIRVSDTVDDVRIFVRVRPIASQTTTGNPTIGTGFSFQIRASDSLPILGAVLLNSDLLDEVEAQGLLDELMLHELGHCLGVGISWDHFGLLYNSSRQNHTADTYFAGFQARRGLRSTGWSVV